MTSTSRSDESRLQPTSIWAGALHGGLASAGACVLSNPIDVVRTRLQVVQPVRAQSTLTTLRELANLRGALQAGLSTAMAYNVVLNTTRFAAYEHLSAGPMGLTPFIAGLGAGFLSGWISSPLARARTILQMDGGNTATYSWSSLLLSRHSFAAAPMWAMRNAGHTALIFSLFEWGRQHLEAASPSTPSTILSLASSAYAATVSCVLLNPLDLACSRAFYLSAGHHDGATSLSPRHTSALDCVQRVLNGEGPLGLYRGLGANLLRMVPHTTATFVLLNTIRSFAVRSGHAVDAMQLDMSEASLTLRIRPCRYDLQPEPSSSFAFPYTPLM